MISAKAETTARKRKAAAMLQELALELGVPKLPGGADLAVPAFNALHTSVTEKCATPEQRARADDLLALFRGDGQHRGHELPSQAQLPALPCAGAAVVGSSSGASLGFQQPPPSKGFRLRGTSCQFTYNSMKFTQMGADALWELFVSFLKTLSFVTCWTATLEESLRSLSTGRLHLHVFVEFAQAVDWTTLSAVMFMGVRPHATPTIARGTNQREVGSLKTFTDAPCRPAPSKASSGGPRRGPLVLAQTKYAPQGGARGLAGREGGRGAGALVVIFMVSK